MFFATEILKMCTKNGGGMQYADQIEDREDLYVKLRVLAQKIEKIVRILYFWTNETIILLGEIK